MIEKVISWVSEYFKVPIHELSSATKAIDIDGWDSLAHADFLIFVEKECNIIFNLSDLMEMEDLSSLAKIIEKSKS